MTLPELDQDLFSWASPGDPVSGCSRLRDDGPVVKLSHPAFNATKGHGVLQSDGEVHGRLRTEVMREALVEALPFRID